MPDTTHHIGLLLGTEDDWPTAFETIVSRLGSIKGEDGSTPPHRRRAPDHRALRPARQAAPRAGRRSPRLLVLPPARVAEEGGDDGRRLPAQQPLHLPVDGEARRLLRDDPLRAEGAAHGARALQAPARQRALGLHGGPLQPPVRPRRGRRARRLPAVHEALRRRAVGRRHARPRRGRAAPRLRPLGRAAHAPAGRHRQLRRLRPLAVDRPRDDGHALPPRGAAARPLRRLARLPHAARSARRSSPSAGSSTPSSAGSSTPASASCAATRSSPSTTPTPARTSA